MKEELERLREIYFTSMMEGLQLEAFLERVARGDHGRFSGSTLRKFLDHLEGEIRANIETKLTETPQWRNMGDRMEEIHSWLEELKEKYGGEP